MSCLEFASKRILSSFRRSRVYGARTRKLFFDRGAWLRFVKLSEIVQCFHEVFLRSEVADCEHVSPHALPEPVQANLR